MPRKNALLETFEPIILAGIVSAHFASNETGFRLRDVRFYVELFSNWLAYFSPSATLGAQNTQISRYLSELEKGGFLKRKGREKRYVLTRVGILEALQRFVARAERIDFPQFLFMRFFLKAYAPKLEALIERAGTAYSPAFQIEARALLDHRHFLVLHRRALDTQLKKLQSRIAETRATVDFARREYRRGAAHPDVVQAVEKKFPYQLNSQKRFSALMSDFTEADGAWELVEGNAGRVEMLFSPLEEILRGYATVLRDLDKK